MPTIKELKEKIKELPDTSRFYAYEGEGGSWIIFYDPTKSINDDNRTILEINTNEDPII